MLNKLKLWAARVVLRNAGAPVWGESHLRYAENLEIIITDGKLWINSEKGCHWRCFAIGELAIHYHGMRIHHFRFTGRNPREGRLTEEELARYNAIGNPHA